MASSWAERYRAKTLADVLGNASAVQVLRAWAQDWQGGTPAKKAILLHGPPGCGKTSAAHALANDLGWGVLELNASDVRSANAIQRVAGEGSRHETFSVTGDYFASAKGLRKLIILDEADNLYERGGEGAHVGDENFSDRGGKRAIFDTIAATRQPIVLIANDPYPLTKGASATLQKHVLVVPFRAIDARTMLQVLQQVAQTEEIQVDDSTLRAIAQRAQGDVRSALNDLQALGEGGLGIRAGQAEALGSRDRPESMQAAMAAIFKGTDAMAARRIVETLEEEPSFILAWLDENVPREYRDPRDLVEAYEWISRADIFLGRVSRRQHYRLWAHAKDLLVVGVTAAKSRPYPGNTYYQFPSWIRKMSISRGQRGIQKELLQKLAPFLHVGFRTGRAETLPFLRTMFLRDEEFAEENALRWNLDEDEIRAILGPRASEGYADQIVKHVESRRAQPASQKQVEEPVAPVEEEEETPPVPSAPTKPSETDKGRSKSLLDF